MAGYEFSNFRVARVLNLTEKAKDDIFGYLMELRSPNCKDFRQFLLVKEKPEIIIGKNFPDITDIRCL